MIRIEINGETGECRQQNKGTAKELLIESVAIVHSLYENMLRNPQFNIQCNAAVFRAMLKTVIDDDTFWDMKADERIIVNMDPKEAKPQ